MGLVVDQALVMGLVVGQVLVVPLAMDMAKALMAKVLMATARAVDGLFGHWSLSQRRYKRIRERQAKKNGP